jgi:hypothetical protein
MDELASLQESAREIALERFRIIQPYLEQDRSLSVIARNAGIPYRTIHRRVGHPNSKQLFSGFYFACRDPSWATTGASGFPCYVKPRPRSLNDRLPLH